MTVAEKPSFSTCGVSDFKVFPWILLCVQIEEMGLLIFQIQFDLTHFSVIAE